MFSSQETDRVGSTEESIVSDRHSSAHQHTDPSSVDAAFAKLGLVRNALQKIIRGKEDVIDLVLTSMLAGGSVLLEDVPGVGKTTLAKSLASLIDLEFARVQCTPDLLPADIIGCSIFQPTTGKFEFRPGPIFCDLLIADEINRASPRTQSALLEAMAESQVTIDGTCYELHQPFMVIATQNPNGFEGTFPLPESQLDRFLLRLSMNYPDPSSEVDMLMGAGSEEVDLAGSPQSNGEPAMIQNLMDREELLTLQSAVQRIRVDRKIASYIVELASATRRDKRVRVGCSPRGSKMLLAAAKSSAFLQGRTFVLPDDIQALAVHSMAHRMSARGGLAAHSSCESIVTEIVEEIAVPT